MNNVNSIGLSKATLKLIYLILHYLKNVPTRNLEETVFSVIIEKFKEGLPILLILFYCYRS